MHHTQLPPEKKTSRRQCQVILKFKTQVLCTFLSLPESKKGTTNGAFPVSPPKPNIALPNPTCIFIIDQRKVPGCNQIPNQTRPCECLSHAWGRGPLPLWIKPYQNIPVTLCRGVDPSQHTLGRTRGGLSRGCTGGGRGKKKQSSQLCRLVWLGPLIVWLEFRVS